MSAAGSMRRFGLFADGATVDSLVLQASTAAEQGFASFWTPQIFQVDALTALAIVAREVPDIGLGTAVVPTYPRHPAMLAAQALTTSQVSRGRLTLGIGLSHQFVIESIYGLSYDKPVRHMREYLSILMPLLHGEAAAFNGETLTGNIGLDIPGGAPVPVVVAALGAQMLKLAGTKTEGTVTWMTGPATISSHVAPSINAAATDAGRPAPRVVAALPVCVTDDVADAREKASATFAIYGHLPAYRAMLDREGAAGPAEVAIVGDEDTVRAGIEGMFAAGATEFVVVPYANRERTLALVQSMF